ncbi:MAG: glycosyltransferase family 2 protein [Nitrospirae bacterium]|nr:glycosyltransferase family 2 protein [Nitrospirota bacterium]
MNQTRELVGVVLLNWNQEQDTSECLESLRLVRDVPLRVILVDNGSARDSVDRLERRFPEATVIRLPENRGFAAGNNVGIERALQEGVSHVLLLNNDTLVEAGFLKPLLDALRRDRAGAAGPKIYHHPDVARLWFAGGMINWRAGRQWHLGAGDIDQGQWDSPREVDYITACCLLAPAQVFREVGGLDERYFIYFEETDWNLRVRQRGYHCWYEPQSRIFHKVSRAMHTGSPASDYYYARNRLLLFLDHAPMLYRPFLLALYTLRSLRFAWTRHGLGLPGNARAVARGVLDFYAGRFGRCPFQFNRAPAVQPREHTG